MTATVAGRQRKPGMVGGRAEPAGSTWASRSLTSTGFIALARRVDRNFDGIVNAVTHRLSNSLTKGLTDVHGSGSGVCCWSFVEFQGGDRPVEARTRR
jgi:hypothetical protein